MLLNLFLNFFFLTFLLKYKYYNFKEFDFIKKIKIKNIHCYKPSYITFPSILSTIFSF